MNFLSPLLDLNFWFDLTPIRMSAGFEAVFFALFALSIMAGSIIRMMVRNKSYSKYEAIIMKRAAVIASYAGFAGLVWFFFSFEEIQFFGARFWFLILLIGVIVAGVRLYRYKKHEVPQLEYRDQSRAEVNKYLPRRAR